MPFDSLPAWLAWQESLHPQVINLGLERAAQVFKDLNPNKIKPLTIIVAGTNGKGSSIAFLESIYQAQGYRVGAYTSPHILEYNERIRINGQSVDDSTICQAFERIEAVRNNTSLSYFEFGTLAALDIFWRADLEIQLLEVGLGGRLDAVNIIDADAVLVSSIDLDHCDWLGHTREAIGYEKAGVFRADIPVIVAEYNPPQSLIDSARQQQAKLFLIGQDFDFQRDGAIWHWYLKTKKIVDLPLPALQGEQQFYNATAVLAMIDKLAEKLPVSKQSICEGLKNVQLKGRFQFIDDEVPILLDVGHNPQAVKALVNYLTQRFSGKRIHAVFSMMKDKDIAGVIELMKPLVFTWYVSPLKNSRTATRVTMKQVFQQCNMDNVFLEFDDFKTTFSFVKSQVSQDDIIVIFGSFFLVSEFLLARNQGEL